jgi:tetratricopeptide (TPR) repeat protein
MRSYILSAALLLAVVAPALAEMPDTRAGALVMLSDSPVELRAALLAYADSAAATGDPAGAGEALAYTAQSLQREGQIDSAIACYRRALVLNRADETALAFIDQLLLRRRPGDLAEALSLLAELPAYYEGGAAAEIVGRVAWGRFQLGQIDTAHALFTTVARGLTSRPEWRYRMARVALEQKDYHRAADLLLPEAVRTRGTDEDVVAMLERAGNALGMTGRLQEEMRRRVADSDRRNQALAGQLGGQLVTLTASDGFTLGGMLVPAASPRHRNLPLLAIVLLSAPDTLAAADSLVTALHRHGITTLLLHPRGSGLSVGPSCPSPESWFSREASLQARVARDVGDAARWVRSHAPVDTTRCLVVGVGSGATMAVEAATLDPRVKALLLVSPVPALVDRGTTRARLARLQLPVFFQIAGDDLYPSYLIAEALYQAGNRGASRVVESHMSGSGLAQFRDEPELARRFLTWLDATLSAAPAPRRPTRPGSRR